MNYEMDQKQCIVCDANNTVARYEDWTCCKCGQVYEYDENHQIVLTPRQIAKLKTREVTLGKLVYIWAVGFAAGVICALLVK